VQSPVCYEATLLVVVAQALQGDDSSVVTFSAHQDDPVQKRLRPRVVRYQHLPGDLPCARAADPTLGRRIPELLAPSIDAA
jgi:hypothetical protein